MIKKYSSKTHGLSRHRLFSRWAGMIDRCFNEKNANYRNYGGRGIRVCKRWLDVTKFIEDMDSTFDPKLTLERINNDEGYSPSNCKWATQKEQVSNRRQKKEWSEKPKTFHLCSNKPVKFQRSQEALEARIARHLNMYSTQMENQGGEKKVILKNHLR